MKMTKERLEAARQPPFKLEGELLRFIRAAVDGYDNDIDCDFSGAKEGDEVYLYPLKGRGIAGIIKCSLGYAYAWPGPSGAPICEETLDQAEVELAEWMGEGE
jgi:hypothetical protein